LEKLIRELTSRGYRLAVVKHHRHAGLRFDTPGKDTWRFAQAGAEHVMLAGPDRAYHVRRYQEEPPLEELVGCIDSVDLILTEGHKRANTPKIEVIRGPEEPVLVSNPNQVVAIASDRAVDLGKREFDLNDPISLVDFIEARFIAPEPPAQESKEGS
jgi:molybdopterin-guanine dinucleotide biosynthesis protein B